MVTAKELDDLAEIEIKTAQDLIDYIQAKFTSPEIVPICSCKMLFSEVCIAAKCKSMASEDNDNIVDYLVLAFNDIEVTD